MAEVRIPAYEPPKIYTAIMNVMKDCGAVGKDSRNQQQNYNYRGIDAVMNALNPALIKNRIFVIPEVLEQSREERQNSKGGLLIYSVCTVKYTFYAEDGSSVSSVVTGEGMDSGDKATNKAMSAAFKYALFQTFCIPTEEMVDSEIDSPEPAPKQETKQKTKPAEPKQKVISAMEKGELLREMNRTGITKDTICKTYGVQQIDDILSDMFPEIMRRFAATADKAS